MSTFTINIPESEVDIDIDVAEIAAAIDIDPYSIASELDLSDVAAEIDHEAVADRISLSTLSEYLDAADVASEMASQIEIDYYDLGQYVDHEAVAEYVSVDAEEVAAAVVVDMDIVIDYLVGRIDMSLVTDTVARRILDTLTSDPELEQRNKDLSLDLQRATDEVERLSAMVLQLTTAPSAPTPQPYDVPLSTGESQDFTDRYGF